MRNTVELYNWAFPELMPALEREFYCIRQGGQWKRKDGKTAGMGLKFHFKRAISILWPEFIQHRWFDVILEAYLTHEWIGLAGPKNAGKTASMAVILLVDYYAFPTQTTIILSSTTKEGLDNRVFSEVKMRHKSARNRHDLIPGNLIEGRLRIVTDNHDEFKEGRDFRNGFVGVPIRIGDKNSMDNIVGIKNKRKRWFIDEAQTLPSSALDGTANFMEPGADCKFIGAGNCSDIMDAHGKLCEPHTSLGGWNSGIDQQGKTKMWRTRFENGVCVQLPGGDSPNFDVEPNAPVPFPFLMTREQMEKDAKTWMRTDWHYQMFNEGRWPRGQAATRVITRQMCIAGRATEPARFANTNIIKIGAMDAGFGGDRCIFHELHFGREIWMPEHRGEVNVSNLISQEPPVNDNRQIIAFVDTQIIPIKGDDVKDAEDQIVVWCKRECERRGILTANMFYEPGMRTSLVQKFTSLWSDKPVAIDFGGKPSDGQVSSDIPVACRDYYFNFVTELWYSFRLVIECQQARGLSEQLIEEGCMREYMKVGGNKIQIETKKDFKAKTGFSPDLFDAAVVGLEGAKRRGFNIKRQKPPDFEEEDDTWKRELEQKAKKFREHGRLLLQ